MATGIYKTGLLGIEEVKQKHIDYWCGMCQFPLESPQCTSQRAIQACWDGSQAIAGEWHKQHECPFLHIKQECKCNDYTAIEDAFEACKLDYYKNKD